MPSSKRRVDGVEVTATIQHEGAVKFDYAQMVALERHGVPSRTAALSLDPSGLDAKGLALVVVQLDARRRRPPEDVLRLGHAREAGRPTRRARRFQQALTVSNESSFVRGRSRPSPRPLSGPVVLL